MTDPVPSEPRLRVKWSGNDEEVGAGLAVFDVYGSEKSGHYKPWLQNTKLFDAVYIVNSTSTCDFVTIAKDNVGNGEEEIELPDGHRPVAFAGGPYSATEGVALPLDGSSQELRLNLSIVKALNTSKALKVVADQDDKLTIDRQWKYTQSRLDNGNLVHGYANKEATLELQNYKRRQNLINKYDVNGNDSIELLGVLIIINQINSTAGTNESSKLPAFDPSFPSRFSFLDVNGDSQLSPLDVLELINAINNHRRVAARARETRV